MQPVISESLQSTLLSNEKIKNVYFDSKGRHYFVAYNLIQSKDNTEKKLYGTGVFSHRQVIPGLHNIEKRTEDIAKGEPSTLIVFTMTREEVLSANAKKEGKSIASVIANATSEEKNVIAASLFDKETIDILNAIKEGKIKLSSQEEKKPEQEEKNPEQEEKNPEEVNLKLPNKR